MKRLQTLTKRYLDEKLDLTKRDLEQKLDLTKKHSDQRFREVNQRFDRVILEMDKRFEEARKDRESIRKELGDLISQLIASVDSFMSNRVSQRQELVFINNRVNRLEKRVDILERKK